MIQAEGISRPCPERRWGSSSERRRRPRINGTTTLKARRFSEEQIIHRLQQAEPGEQSIDVLYREHTLTRPTCCRWSQKFGDMTIPKAQQFRDQAEESPDHERLLAARDLEIDGLRALRAQHA